MFKILKKNSSIVYKMTEEKVDYLDVDDAVPGQNYVCLSFVSPESLIESKEAFKVAKFIQAICKDKDMDVNKTLEQYKDYTYKYQEELQKDFDERNKFQTNIRGLKVRGTYLTREEAERRAEKLQKIDSDFHVFVGQVGYWLPWDPCADKIEDEKYLDSQLNDMMDKYKENNVNKDIFYEEQKRDKVKAAREEALRKKREEEESNKEIKDVKEEPVKEEEEPVKEEPVKEEPVKEEPVEENTVINDTVSKLTDSISEQKDSITDTVQEIEEVSSWSGIFQELVNNKGESVACDTLNDLDVVGIYFSAHWCPPCRKFTPSLVESYNKMKASGKKIEIVFVSADKDVDGFNEYFSEMPWLAVKYGSDSIDELNDRYGVSGIPALVFVNPKTGDIITKDGREKVTSDPEGDTLPWTKEGEDNVLSSDLKSSLEGTDPWLMNKMTNEKKE